MKEIWKDIKGYAGMYQISNLGRVKSFQLCGGQKLVNKKKIERILKPFIKDKRIKNKYLSVSLYRNNSKTITRIHRLVAMYFIKNPKRYLLVNHKNGNRFDNRYSNLEWVHENYFHYINNPLGYSKVHDKYMAYISIKGKSFNLGLFETKEEAHSAYLESVKKYRKFN